MDQWLAALILKCAVPENILTPSTKENFLGGAGGGGRGVVGGGVSVLIRPNNLKKMYEG